MAKQIQTSLINDKVGFGSFLRAGREKYKISRGKLSKLIDCSTQFIRHWECGRTAPPKEKFKSICKHLQISEERLIEEILRNTRLFLIEINNFE